MFVIIYSFKYSAVHAVCSMESYMSLRSQASMFEPLFVFRSGAVLTRTMLISQLRDLLQICGIQADAYSGHSFRSGGATDSALSGMADWELKLAGRWSSDAYQRYVRAPRSTLTGFASRMVHRISTGS